MWEIYSVGNPTFLIEVFNGLARLWSTGDIYVLLSIALVIGLLWNSLQWATNQEKMPFPAKGFILSIIFVVGLLGPQSLVDVRVTSKRDYSFQEINNVPLLPAVGGWFITNTGTAIADIMAQAFSIVGIDSWEALSPIQHFVGLSAVNFADVCTPNPLDNNINVCKSFNVYLDECYVVANMVSPGATNPIEPVLSAKPADIMGLLKVTNPNLNTTSYLVPGNSQGEKISCELAWSKLDSQMKSGQYRDNLEKSLSAQGSSLAKVSQFLNQYSMQGVIPSAESSFDLANAAFIGSVFNNYFPSTPYGQQVSHAMFDTIRQRQLANASKKEYWMENAEVMQSFFEALTVFLTPFLGLVLAISGQGLLAVGQYFAAWMFVQMWSIMIVLVNLFTALAMTNRFNDAVAAGKSQFSLTAIDSQFATANSYIGISGMLYTFIPAICVFVLYRGVHAMQGMAKQAMADPSIDSKRLSPDTGTSIQNGNAQFGNQTSQYETNTGRHLNGDSLVSSSAGKFSVGESIGSSVSSGASSLRSQAATLAQNAQQSLDSIFNESKGGNFSKNTGESQSFQASSVSEWASSAANAISKATGMSFSEAQQLVASGAVSADAKGGLSLSAGFGGKGQGPSMAAKVGASFSADLKATAQANANSSEEAKESYNKNLQELVSNKDAINQNLSKITTASDVASFSDTAAVQEAAKQSAAYTRQSQALEQQGLMLTQMATNSGQVSTSRDIDFAGLSASLSKQDIGSFLSKKNPELWEKIKDLQVDGMSGDKWLDEKTVSFAQERESKSANAIGEGRALALQELMKENDKINMQEGGRGIDIGKEKADAEMNRDIFQSMAANGVVNTTAAGDLYQNKVNTLDAMGNTSSYLDQSKAPLEQVAPKMPTADEFTNAYGAREQGSQAMVNSALHETLNGHANVANAAEDNKAQFKKQGEQLTGGVDGVGSAPENFEKKIDKLDRTHSATAQLFNTIGDIPAKLGEMTKPEGDRAMNNLITQLASSEEGAKWVGENVKGDTANGMNLLSDFKGDPTEKFNRGVQVPGDEGRQYQSLLQSLDNPQLMRGLLGEDGQGTPLAKQNFKEEELAKLNELNSWYQSYTQGNIGGEKAINEVIKQNANGMADTSSGNPILNALSNDGVVNSFNSDNATNSLNDKNKTADVLNKVLNGENVSDIIKDDKVFTLQYAEGRSMNLTKGDHDSNANNLADIKELAAIIKPSLSEDKQQVLENALSQFEQEIPSIDDKLQNNASQDKDNIQSARLAGTRVASDESFTSNAKNAYNALIDANMTPEHVRYDARPTKSFDDVASHVESAKDVTQLATMYENSKPFISHDSQGKIEADLNKLSEQFGGSSIYPASASPGGSAANIDTTQPPATSTISVSSNVSSNDHAPVAMGFTNASVGGR
ncbi:conjugal transfer protein TraG N-terminal domain-containing protein [Shewanella sp. SM74]|uniref:conjugal transfer protein TraG N-terminal domain-containing protein n=1 Tax=Shewanella TaxID=22 RepID=UPI0021DAB2C9|nr:conjugal transfer protein TraG N-terminal domain-containing protein [Shewanella sp. SM74]MCU8013842.1 conjugal transfer protein TraG N-terminal domain-containing protein [Shewanella sp. SM74]